MAVPYVSLHARILEALAAHLAAGAAVQAFLGVTDAEAARAEIVEIDGDARPGAHVLLTAPRMRFSRTPGSAFRGTGNLGLILCAPTVAEETAAEDQRRALNHLTPIMQWLTRLTQPILVRDLEDSEPVILDLSDGRPGWVCFGIDLTADVTL